MDMNRELGSAESDSVMLAHIYTDVHDISRRLAAMENVMAEFTALLPLARQYSALSSIASMTRLGKHGRIKEHSGMDGAE